MISDNDYPLAAEKVKVTPNDVYQTIANETAQMKSNEGMINWSSTQTQFHMQLSEEA